METGGTSLSESDLRQHIRSLQNGALNPCPSLLSASDVPIWAYRLAMAFASQGIQRVQWSDAAIIFLEGENHREVHTAMRQRKRARLDLGVMVWEWQDFLVALREVLAELVLLDVPSQFTSQAAKAAKIGLIVAGTGSMVAGAGLVVVGGVVLAPVAAVVGLNVLGFTAAGVAAGSVAAGVQSVVYGGATAGLFSICQSIGATAAVPAVGSIITGAGSIISGAGSIFAGAAAVVASSDKNRDSDDDKGSNPPAPLQLSSDVGEAPLPHES